MPAQQNWPGHPALSRPPYPHGLSDPGQVGVVVVQHGRAGRGPRRTWRRSGSSAACRGWCRTTCAPGDNRERATLARRWMAEVGLSYGVAGPPGCVPTAGGGPTTPGAACPDRAGGRCRAGSCRGPVPGRASGAEHGGTAERPHVLPADTRRRADGERRAGEGPGVTAGRPGWRDCSSSAGLPGVRCVRLVAAVTDCLRPIRAQVQASG